MQHVTGFCSSFPVPITAALAIYSRVCSVSEQGFSLIFPSSLFSQPYFGYNEPKHSAPTNQNRSLDFLSIFNPVCAEGTPYFAGEFEQSTATQIFNGIVATNYKCLIKPRP